MADDVGNEFRIHKGCFSISLRGLSYSDAVFALAWLKTRFNFVSVAVRYKEDSGGGVL